MNKKPSGLSERSKVKILFVEGDFAPGDLKELTQALTSAIKPNVIRYLPKAGPQLLANDVRNSNSEDVLDAADEDVYQSDDSPELDDAPEEKAKAPGKPRTYRKPTPVNIDMSSGGKSFKDFSAEKGPTSHRAKYLVAAAWLHDYAKIESITADHVFTCYKSANWNFDIGDPTVTFRQLKKDALGSLEKGHFKINHLGIAEVFDMKPSK